MSDSISGRTRTPPDLKWLINERAAIAGAVEKATARCNHLTCKLARLQKSMEMANKQAQDAFNTKGRHQRALDALDTAIGLAYSQVRVDAAGIVNAWAGRYGERGALKKFVEKVLREAFPAAVDMRQLIDQTVYHFGIPVVTPADRRALKHSVKSSLAGLLNAGKVECSRNPAGGHAPSIWRIKPPASFADIAAKAERMARTAAEARNARATDSNPS